MSCVNYFLTALLAVTLPLFFFVNGFLLFGKTFDAKKHGKKSSMPLVIDTDEVFHDGNYCVYQILENGDKRYTTNRGVIDRLSKTNAEILQKQFTESLIAAKKEGNPFGYSSKTFMYGQYEKILEQVGDKEDFIECTEAKAELYNESVAKIYNDCETYYAPIIYLSVEGEPYICKCTIASTP